MPSDWSVIPQDPASLVITPFSPESVGSASAVIRGASNFSSVGWPTGNTATYIPFVISAPTTIVGGAVYNGTTATGNLDLGVYDDQQNRLVSAVQTNGGSSIAQSGTSAWQTVSLTSTTLDPGVYYMALVFSSTSSTVFTPGGTTNVELRTLGCLLQASALPLPSTATFAVSSSGFSLPVIALTTRSFI